jgi:hypothetical protein
LFCIRRLFTQQIDGAVRRHAIYHQVLTIFIVLKSNTLERFSNEARLVEGRGNDGDEWGVFHETLLLRLRGTCLVAHHST